MSFLPIVDRELRVLARQRSTFRFRQGGAGVAILAVGLLLLVADLSSSNPNGGDLFGFLAGLVFLYGVFEGARNTADCLSEEKRAGTLGLLWLTDLRGYDIVLGKLLATSLNSFYALLAVLPPLAIPLVLGGVTAGEFWRMVLVLVCTLIGSVTSGLFVSAIARSEGRAWLGTLALAVAMCLGPGLAFRASFDAAYQASARAFWLGLLPVPVLGSGLLWAATWALPRACQDARISEPKSWIAWFQSWWPRSWAAWHRRARRRLLVCDPARWLASREQVQGWSVGVAVALACVGVALLNPDKPGSPFLPGRWIGSMLLVNFLLAAWMAWLACQAFARARSSGTLELLLTTPIAAGEWIDEHFRALRRLFLAPTVCLYAVGFLLPLMHRAVRAGSSLGWTETLGMALVASLLLLFALLDLSAVAWFGLWMGLRSSKVGPALTKTVLYVLGLPLAGSLFCLPVCPLIWLVKDVIFINYGRDQLRKHLRVLAAGESAAPYAPGPFPRLRTPSRAGPRDPPVAFTAP